MNWNIFGPMYEKVMKRIPILEKTGIKSTIVGPESFTPDNQPVLGKLHFPKADTFISVSYAISSLVCLHFFYITVWYIIFI